MFTREVSGESRIGLRQPVLATTVVLLALMATATTTKVRRLLAGAEAQGAFDLKHLSPTARMWFEGILVYGESPAATYPPASGALLWPAWRWASLQVTRWMWCILNLLALAVFSVAFARVTARFGRGAQTCAALARFSMPAYR